MKKFNFRLQRILDIKAIKEEQAQRKLAEARRARSLQLEALCEAESAVFQHHTELRNALRSTVAAGDALISHRYGMKLRRNVGVEKGRLVQSEEVVSDRSKELALAAREKQMYRSLKERKLEEYQTEIVRVEQTELDDEAGQRFNGGRRNKANA